MSSLSRKEMALINGDKFYLLATLKVSYAQLKFQVV
jgi:hypothetical protein